MTNYDFLDFGASKGGSLTWAAANLGGSGLAIERNPSKAGILRANGHSVLQADATRLDLPDKSVRYSVMLDFLEHMPDRAAATRAIGTASRLSRDFLYIAGPDFEEADYLRGLGLKRYYADWVGHERHHGVAELVEVLRSLSLGGLVMEKDRIRDTRDGNLIPLDCAGDSGRYDPALHAEKADHPRDRMLHNRIVAVVPLRPAVDAATILARSLGWRCTPVNGGQTGLPRRVREG